VDVQHRLQFCLIHHSYVKMAALQLYLQSEEKREVARGRQVMLLWAKTFLVKKEV
jgi:hypothetical protein